MRKSFVFVCVSTWTRIDVAGQKNPMYSEEIGAEIWTTQ